MKQRISALDLQLLTVELRATIESYRLNNIYNIADSSRQFLLKFNKPDSKINVVVDCGLKIHTTEFTRPTPPVPSGFVAKLRKHLKAKRLTAVRQVSNDRIIAFQFSEGKFYLVLEFFSAGNVILLDEDFKIMSLQRIVEEHENKVGEKYEMFDISLFSGETGPNGSIPETFNKELVESWFQDEKDFLARSKLNEKKRSIHRLLLSQAPHLSSDLLSKNLKKHDIKSSEPSSKYFEQSDLMCDILNETQREYLDLIEHKSGVGYIVTQENPNYVAGRDQPDLEYIFDSFHPFKPYLLDSEAKKIVEVEGPYNKTLDIFFSTVESSKYALKIQAQEHLAKKKLDDARSENVKRIQTLQEIQTANERKGNLIITHADQIEEAKAAVQGLIDQQLDWSTIEKLIKTEQKKKNKIAELIKLPLKLEQNKIDIKLLEECDYQEDADNSDSDSDTSFETSESDPDSDSDSEDESGLEQSNGHARARISNNKEDKYVTVTIDLALSSYANASEYFSIKKSTVEKQKKVEQNIGMAMKNIEMKVNQQLQKKLKESHDVLKKVRHPYFFEKYYWFISSEGYLVLMGKSPIETDQIYSKYIEDDDIFVSNSFNTVAWIKNPAQTEIPPNTLMQAGMFCMSSSEAWSKKLSASAWWCNADNVSKFSDHDNEVLPAGTYRLKDENNRNILAPSQLVMGVGFLWKIKTPNDTNATEDGTIPNASNNSTIHALENEKEGADELDGDDSGVILGQIEMSEIEDSKKPEYLGEENVSGVDEEEMSVTDNSVSVATSVVDSMKKNVRGKKGKLKKMQRKYKDQDEVERMIRLEALGTLKGIEKKEKKEQEEITKQSQKEYRKARREKQKVSQALQFTDTEKVKINFAQIKEQLRTYLFPDDEVVDVVPIFAPWPALLKTKYKVKVQPGNAKKTKSINEILHFFLNRETDKTKTDKGLDWPLEHDIIKGVKAQELVIVLPVDKMNISIPRSQNERNSKQTKGKGSKTKGKGGNKKK